MTFFKRTYTQARDTITALADSSRPEVIRGVCFTLGKWTFFLSVVAKDGK